MRLTQSIISITTPLIMSLSLIHAAEAKKIEAGEATASWNGTGLIQDIGDGNRVFTGAITGTMFIRHPEGGGHSRIHAAKVDCQAVVLISDDKEERQSALCMMTAHEGKDVAYGEMRCVGKKDDCRGEFTFSWGSGAFKGITGTTPFVGGINIERKEQGRIYGYAAWPNMTYSLP